MTRSIDEPHAAVDSEPSITLTLGETPTPRAAPLFLLVESGPDRGARIDIGDRPIVVGSSLRADLVLRDPTVSRLHAEVLPTPELLLVDLGSRNGTYVSEQRIERAPLAPGSVVRVGKTTLVVTSRRVTRETPVAPTIAGIVAQSESMRRAVAAVHRVAPLDATVLVEGESGTGKEGIARALHTLGPRSTGPLVVVDCGALPIHLVEAELFGCERGAFTGADRARAGAFERADGGTLFLDEIGELPPAVQPKLLRALESREIRRLGSQTTRRVTFRLVSATNRDLVRAVEEGGFRADLFHRLAVLRIALPPLRERPEDIEAIARRFVAETELGRARKISDAAMMRLRTYPWPGNVRELLNVLRASLSLSESLVLDLPDLPGRLSPHDALDETHSSSELPFKQARDVILESFEADYLARVLRRTGGNVSEAARQTGLHRKTIERMARRLGLDVVMLRRES